MMSFFKGQFFRRYKYSVITFLILVPTSFKPVLHLVLMFGHAGIGGSITRVFGYDPDEKGIIILSLIFTVLMSIFFYYSAKKIFSAIATLGTVLFFLPSFLYSFFEIFDSNGNGNDFVYWLPFLLGSIATVLLITLLEYAKSKREPTIAINPQT